MFCWEGGLPTQLYTSKVNISILSMPTTVHKQHKHQPKFRSCFPALATKNATSEDIGETCIFEGSKVEIRLHHSFEGLKQNLSLPNDTAKSDFLQVKLIKAWLKVPKGVEFDSNIQPVLSQQLVFLQSSQVMTKCTTRMLYGHSPSCCNCT